MAETNFGKSAALWTSIAFVITGWNICFISSKAVCSDNVNVVEFDASVIDTLLQNCQKYGEPKVFNEDFLKFDLDIVRADSQQKLKLIGNLPYNISSPILFKVIEQSDKIIDAHFMLQKEVVERIISQPNSKTYGRLSVILQYHFDCSMILNIPPEVFYPQPKVDSAILRLKPKVDKLVVNDYVFFENIVIFVWFQYPVGKKTAQFHLKKLVLFYATVSIYRKKKRTQFPHKYINICNYPVWVLFG